MNDLSPVTNLTPEFLAEFKARTEAFWAETESVVSGPRFRHGTRWRPGLSPEEFAAYEQALGLRFPDDFRLFLRTMNGTDRPMKHTEPWPRRVDPGVYSYPHDLETVKARIAEWRTFWHDVVADVREQGEEIPPGALAIPVFGHRGVLCSEDPSDSRVLSITEGDSIVYSESLRTWLEAEFLH